MSDKILNLAMKYANFLSPTKDIKKTKKKKLNPFKSIAVINGVKMIREGYIRTTNYK